MSTEPMTIREARTAIEAILARIPDSELPKFRVEKRDAGVTAWWGGHGHILGTAKSDGKRNPIQYREHGSWDAIEGEMAYRADRSFLANGDSAEGWKP